jgi:hypothetical protein
MELTMNDMPGSTLRKDLISARWHRLLHIHIEPDVGQRVYECDLEDGCLRAIVGHEPTAVGKLWHISISHRNKDGAPDRCPTWDEMKFAKYRLLPPEVDVNMVLIFPKKNTSSPYIDIHPTCLHLWESIEKDIEKT